VLDDSEADELEVAFWRGGQVSEEGLAWLLEKAFRTIIDLREEDVKDDFTWQPFRKLSHLGR
jgi:NAD+ kinase